jgi:DNA-binding phage protein
MTKQKRAVCRKVAKFLPDGVAEKGKSKFGNFQFSFKDVVTVERDDKIHESKGVRVTQLAKEVGLSPKAVYKILKKKVN